jgi:flagellar motility protein MotE (MotC chaperone)
MARGDKDVQAENADKAAANTASKKERKIRTIEEQIADAEAKAKALREKAEKRKTKVVDEAKDKRAKLVEKRDALNVQILELSEVIGDNAGVLGGQDVAAKDTES